METVETDYRIQVPLFEGPLDLLLHLIKKNDLEIREIPISLILHQYLDYLNLARELNIDLAGEFLEMASELTYIKSKLLLPEPPEEDEGPDPRDELVQKLLEYQRYKEAAVQLMARPLLGREVFRRPSRLEEPREDAPTLEVDTLRLLSIFQDLLSRLPDSQGHEIRRDTVGVTERVVELMERIQGKSGLPFETLFSHDKTRMAVVVTFLALLEMARQKLIRLIQGPTGEIVVLTLFSKEGGS